MAELLEISDLIVNFDIETLARLPVRKQDATDKLRANGQHQAASIVQQMPDSDGVIDQDYADELLVRVHCEMQRLSEEFQHGRRVLQLLQPMLRALAEQGAQAPYRIVDIGCGTGYVMRWLAMHVHEFEQDVELIGVDFNRGLIDEAKRLSEQEHLQCRFEVTNAFKMERPATLFLSTGVVHHFRGQGLADFFAQHDQPETLGFAHFDFQPTIFARPGAWLFHFIRMREPLSKHDGVVSARRAHHADALVEAARSSTTFRCGMFSRWIGGLPLPRVFQTVLGIRPRFEDAFREALGSRASRLEELA